MFAGFISTLGGADRHSVRKSEERNRCGRARRRRGRRLLIEPLEGRRLLAAELPDGTFASGGAATSVLLSGGSLVIEDTALGGKNDALTLSLNGTNVRIVDPNNGLAAGAGMTQVDAQTVDVPLASIAGSIQINAGGAATS